MGKAGFQSLFLALAESEEMQITEFVDNLFGKEYSAYVYASVACGVTLLLILLFCSPETVVFMQQEEILSDTRQSTSRATSSKNSNTSIRK